MGTKTYGYARVSTTDQNLDRQIIQLTEFGVDERNIITDKKSGKDFDREGYKLLSNILLREGDTLVISSVDRLGRNKKEIKSELESLQKRDIQLRILDLPTTLIEFPEDQRWIQEMVNNILLEVYTAIAEDERSRILERQKEGIDAAKRKGKYLGRPRISFPENWEDVYTRWINKEITAKAAMEMLSLKRTTFYSLVKKFRNL